MENVRPKRPLFPIRAGHSRFSCSSMSRGLMARFASNARGLVRYPCTLSHAKARGSSVTDVGNFPSRPSRLRVRLLTYHLTHQGLQNKVKTVHYCIVSSYFRNFCRMPGWTLWPHAEARGRARRGDYIVQQPNFAPSCERPAITPKPPQGKVKCSTSQPGEVLPRP